MKSDAPLPPAEDKRPRCCPACGTPYPEQKDEMGCPVCLLRRVLEPRAEEEAGLPGYGPSRPGRYRSWDYNHSSKPADDTLCRFARLNSQAASTGTGKDFSSRIACYRM